LKKRDEDTNELGERVVRNIEQLISPLLEKIKGRKLDATQSALFEILESNLANIASPFSKNIVSRHLELTSTEFTIANYIRSGKTTKEIAEITHLSSRTIETHRFRIRKKLDLNSKKISLQSYLLSLQ
jgi:DNA-binding NarL/FixJ family response regulator